MAFAPCPIDGSLKLGYVVDDNSIAAAHYLMAQLNNNLNMLDVARELGRSLEQVRRYVREGKLPAKKLGLQWFVSRAALESFKAGRRPQTRADILAKAKALREEIGDRSGNLDVVALLVESRRDRL